MNRVLTSDDFYFQNDYFDDVINNPSKYSYEEVVYTSVFSIYPNELLDYLLLNCGIDNKEEVFKQKLIELRCYNSYLNKVINGDDNFLKAHVILYLENDLLYSVFDDEYDLACAVINSENYNLEYKIYDLMTLTEYECSAETIDLIKSNVLSFIEKYTDDLSSEQLETVKNIYLKQIEENQSYFNRVYTYKKEN